MQIYRIVIVIYLQIYPKDLAVIKWNNQKRQLALHSGLVGLEGHGSHSRARTPQRRGRQGHLSPCVTKPMVDGHGQVGKDNPSGCDCYVGDRRFCRGCRTRRGDVEDGLGCHYGGSLVWYCQYALLWYLQCYVTHRGEIQELERSQVLVKRGSYCVIVNRIFCFTKRGKPGCINWRQATATVFSSVGKRSSSADMNSMVCLSSGCRWMLAKSRKCALMDWKP